MILSPRGGEVGSAGGEGTHAGSAGFAGEFVEEGVFAVVRGPDCHIVAPGYTALGGFPEKPGIGVFSEFVEADVASMNGHSARVGGESNNTRAIVELNKADLYFISEAGGFAIGIKSGYGKVIFTVRDDGAGEIEQLSEAITKTHEFDGGGIIFGGKEVIAFFEAEPFTDVFETIGKGPADANGFFGQGEDLVASRVERIFGLNPMDLVLDEEPGEHGIGVDFYGRQDGGHFFS